MVNQENHATNIVNTSTDGYRMGRVKSQRRTYRNKVSELNCISSTVLTTLTVAILTPYDPHVRKRRVGEPLPNVGVCTFYAYAKNHR